MKLSDCPSRSNNLQLMRFLAAVLVILSHAFALSQGADDGEWLLELTNSQLSMGGFAVSIFFCAGGYLIAKSMDRVQDGVVYFKTRILRIVPLLTAVAFISAFLIGPCVTQYTLSDYFKDPQTYKYLLNGILILQHDLPGVFLNNPYAPTVNGSLWTLPVEFLCYIGCYLMWKLQFFNKKYTVYSIPLVLAGVIALNILVKITGFTVLLAMIRPVMLFYMGILYYLYRDKIILTGKGSLLCLIVLLITNYFNILNVGMILCFPYILLFVSFAIRQIPDKLGNSGNMSYGIYLCAFPIQQILVSLHNGSMNPYVNMLYAVPLSLLFGYLLYRFIEEPLTDLGKKYLFK